jgi:hypothetical protein
MNFLIES